MGISGKQIYQNVVHSSSFSALRILLRKVCMQHTYVFLQLMYMQYINMYWYDGLIANSQEVEVIYDE
jgi:hypothetical protein